MNAKRRIFFIFGAFRSGTTAFCHFLRVANNAEVSIEQQPKLGVEARLLYEGKLDDPAEVIRLARQRDVEDVLSMGKIYADKNPNYLPFISYLAELFDCHFLFLHRDGRDVVRSMMDWHDVGGKSIFTLAEDGDHPNRTDGSQFPWDYSLLRPREDEAFYEEWKELPRFEKCTWYWSRYNELALQAIHQYADQNRFLTVGLTKATPEDIERAYDFMGLHGFDKNTIASLMNARINSLQWNAAGEDRYPSKENWPRELQEAFGRFAADTMNKLGYS